MTTSSALAARLGRRVRSLRAGLGITVRELSTSSGLSPRLLALVEAGEANPTLSSLADLARALSVDVGALLRDDDRPRSLALVGLRGAGKSTVGKRLAEVLGWSFVEVDRRIEQDSGLSLTALFELHGEQHVRQLEARVLGELVVDVPSVIACGGGVVTSGAAWSLLQAKTTTVWLKATPQEHWDRVRAQGDERPMAMRSTARAELDALWSTRAPLYAQAAVHIDTTTTTVEQAVLRLAAIATSVERGVAVSSS